MLLPIHMVHISHFVLKELRACFAIKRVLLDIFFRLLGFLRLLVIPSYSAFFPTELEVLVELIFHFRKVCERLYPLEEIFEVGYKAFKVSPILFYFLFFQRKWNVIELVNVLQIPNVVPYFILIRLLKLL